MFSFLELLQLKYTLQGSVEKKREKRMIQHFTLMQTRQQKLIVSYSSTNNINKMFL